MRKYEELANPKSCLNRAADNEMVFVLRAHDPCAPQAIRAWAAARITSGRNAVGDAKIQEALTCAASMELEAEYQC